jgi:ferritin-like metal-binding protein YciE
VEQDLKSKSRGEGGRQKGKGTSYNLSKQLNHQDKESVANSTNKVAEAFEKRLLQTKVKVEVLERILNQLGPRSHEGVDLGWCQTLTKM